MPAYIIADIQVPTPPATISIAPLRRPASRGLAAAFRARRQRRLLEGAPEPERIVVIEFPDADTARRWYSSEEYRKALKIRQSASRGRVFLVEGA